MGAACRAAAAACNPGTLGGGGRSVHALRPSWLRARLPLLGSHTWQPVGEM